jgi:drug/metabolite transporter (DMT)-like permease
MYHYILVITIFDLLKPYFRKHILKSLETHEFLFINTAIIMVLTISYFIYEFFFDRKFFVNTYENFKVLNGWQYISLLIVSLLTVLSTTLLLKLDKIHTPAINNILLKSFSLVLLFLVGIILFRENYSSKQILGIFITIMGILMLTV